MPRPLGLARGPTMPQRREQRTCPPSGPWSQEADGSWFCVAPWDQQHYHRAAGEDAGCICPWVEEEGLAIKEALR